MGGVADSSGIQFRVLNRWKGPAVRQMDRDLYKENMQKLVVEGEGMDNLEVLEASAEDCDALAPLLDPSDHGSSDSSSPRRRPGRGDFPMLDLPPPPSSAEDAELTPLPPSSLTPLRYRRSPLHHHWRRQRLRRFSLYHPRRRHRRSPSIILGGDSSIDAPPSIMIGGDGIFEME